ncbi:MAG: hypothetical protein ABSF90_10855 [Syntrophobacteraceae bacterium]
MRGSRVVVFACVLFCAFAFVGFAHSAQPETPAKVVLSPKDPAVIIGKTQTSTQTFTATVFDSKGAKITTPVALTWSVDSDDCTIDQNGVLSVPDTAKIGTFAKAVTAAVTATPSIFGTAGFSIIDTPFTGGVFIGTMSCDKGTCNGETWDLAIDALSSSFNGLLIDNTVKMDFLQFSGNIHKDGSVSASFKNTAENSTITLTGSLVYTDGIVSGMSSGSLGSWTSSKNGNGGTWTTALAATAGAGGKVGTWEITATKKPKAAGLTGPFAAIFEDDATTVAAVALIKENGQLVDGISVPGTWTGDDVSSDNVNFASFAEGGADTNASTHATGTYVPAHKSAAGNMVNAGGSTVGAWKLSNIK